MVISNNASVRTDTATIVLFDPELLRDKLDEDCDWWTGDGDLEREETAGNLVFISTGTDGVFHVVLVAGSCVGSPVKSAVLNVVGNHICFGAGECLPGEGEEHVDELTMVSLPAGRYDVRVWQAPPPSGCSGEYIVQIRAVVL